MSTRRIREHVGVIVAASMLALTLFVASAPTAVGADIFTESFEGGSMAAWSGATRFAVQTQIVRQGSWAGRATATGSTAFAWKALPQGTDHLVVSAWFRVISRSTATHLVSMRAASGSAIAVVGLNASGRLMSYNASGDRSLHSSITPTAGWHQVELVVQVGAAGRIEVWYDDAQLTPLTHVGGIGTVPIARAMIGNNVGGRTFDVAFDDIRVSETRGAPVPDLDPPSVPTNVTAAAEGSRVNLAWDPSTDDVGVQGYTLYRSSDGSPPAPIQTTTSTHFTDIGLNPNTTYQYQVDAFDASGKHSGLSDTVTATTGDRPPDIVIVLTDDQPADTIDRMPNLQADLVDNGVVFRNAIVSNSYCCPSRVSLLRGQYSHTTGIYDVAPPFGGYTDTRRWGLTGSTLATWLNEAGYRTGYVGKYLNGYGVGEVPPGYDVWRASNQAYFDYKVSENGTIRSFGSNPSDYHTAVMSGYADAFIRSSNPAEPIFLQVGTYAPHGPFTPEPKYASDGRCSSVTNTDNPAYNENDVSDKPTYIRTKPKVGSVVGIDHPRAQCRTLLSVDDLVGTVVDALAETGRLNHTLLLFTSDNGYENGEHRWGHKVVPYEGSIRVPFIVRYDPLTGQAPQTEDRLVANIDIAPTIADLVQLTVDPGCPTPKYGGTCAGGFDGISLLPLLDGTATSWRDAVLLEQFNTTLSVSPPTYCGVRTETHVFVRYATGEEELYDLESDPWQLINLLGDGEVTTSDRSIRDQLADRLFGDDGLCSPPPPGYPLPAS